MPRVSPPTRRRASLVKALYRAIVPASLRESRAAARVKARFLPHDWIYDREFYEESVETAAVRSAGRIAGTIIEEFDPTTVIDVGCGTGALLASLRDRGCRVHGLEYAEAALEFCRSRGLDVRKFDLERDDLDDQRVYDVAISMEVAEHLPEDAAARYTDLLTRVSRIVVFTAAPPGQGGTDHVNEQPAAYWTVKFRERGFQHAEDQSRQWRDRWRKAGDVERWYYQNLMIFKRQS